MKRLNPTADKFARQTLAAFGIRGFSRSVDMNQLTDDELGELAFGTPNMSKLSDDELAELVVLLDKYPEDGSEWEQDPRIQEMLAQCEI